MTIPAIRIGMILPSSNTVVEPIAIAMISSLGGVGVHFSRFALTAVHVANPAAAYYDSGALLGAAKLLADAHCHVICWNGSAGGLVGFERDRQLCREITEATGTPATTASLALLDQFAIAGVRRFGMVTLNTPQMNQTIKDHFAREGFECAGSTHRDDMVDNFAMALVTPNDIAVAARECVAACGTETLDALIVYGTNTRGAPVAHQLEQDIGIPVFDSVAWGVFGALRMAGIDIHPLTRWAPH